MKTTTLNLVMLVPGKNERETFEGLLTSRQESLGIRNIHFEILVHPRRDPGCFLEAPVVLQPYQKRAEYSLVVLDHQGSGQENRSTDIVAKDLLDRLKKSGWKKKRTAVLILQPELENWVWSDSREVDRAIGWQSHTPNLRRWLATNNLWPQGTIKPPKPKECLEAALREVRIKRSSAIYRQLAERVGLQRCQDQGFLQFRNLMRNWFPK
jgi:hypothetical protein